MIRFCKHVLFVGLLSSVASTVWAMQPQIESQLMRKALHVKALIDAEKAQQELTGHSFVCTNPEFDTIGSFIVAVIKAARSGGISDVGSVLTRAKDVGIVAKFLGYRETEGTINVNILGLFKKVATPASQFNEDDFIDQLQLKYQLFSFFEGAHIMINQNWFEKWVQDKEQIMHYNVIVDPHLLSDEPVEVKFIYYHRINIHIPVHPSCSKNIAFHIEH